MDGDGNRFAYGFGEVDTIILSDAAIHASNATFGKVDGSRAQIVFTAVPGSPKAETLDTEILDDGNMIADPATATSFSGQFVGTTGESAIGRWSIGEDADAEDLKGAFGVEVGDPVPDPLPQAEDGGAKALTMISNPDEDTVGIGLFGDANNNVHLVYEVVYETAGNAATPVDLKKSKADSGTTLYDGDGGLMGSSYVAKGRGDIEKLLDRIDAIVSLEETGADGDPARMQVSGLR